jgi:PDZ domain-containing protein
MKIRKLNKNESKDLIYTLILGLFIYVFMFMNIPYYIDTPGNLDDVSKIISIDNGYKASSTLNTTYVGEYTNTNLTMYLYSLVNNDWDAYKISDELYDGQSEADAEYEGKADLEESQDYAIMAAYKLASKSYSVNDYNLYVTYIDPNANTNLKVGDDIKYVNAIKIDSKYTMKEIIKNGNDGDKVNLIVNDNESRYAYISVDEDNKYIGILADEDYDLTEDPKVTYNMGDNVSGPSAGFMMSLYIYSSITNLKLPDNLIIAGTGTIDYLGNVGPIGGVKYKLIGSVNKGANIFFVPSENYDEAMSIKEERKYNIEIVKIDTLSDAVKYLEER